MQEADHRRDGEKQW